jgi:hypothetical protein
LRYSLHMDLGAGAVAIRSSAAFAASAIAMGCSRVWRGNHLPEMLSHAHIGQGTRRFSRYCFLSVSTNVFPKEVLTHRCPLCYDLVQIWMYDLVRGYPTQIATLPLRMTWHEVTFAPVA